MALEYFDSIAPFKKLEKNMPVNFGIYLYVLVRLVQRHRKLALPLAYMIIWYIFVALIISPWRTQAHHTVPRHCNCINSCNSSRHLSNDSDDEDADICSGKHSTVLPLAGPECKAGWKTSKVSRITRYYKRYKSRKYGINVSNKA